MMNACTRWSFLAVPVLAAFGCSDPVPLPAQGAVTLEISPGAAGTCPISAGMGYAIGAKKKTGVGVDAPNDVTFGTSVIDGDHGASVSCSVKGQADGTFKFSGSLHSFSGDGNLVTVTITNGTINADKTNGTGQVGVFTTQLVGTYDSGAMPCTFTVLNGQVKGGAIWADFTCPSISETGRACSISKSTIVFGNCAGS